MPPGRRPFLELRQVFRPDVAHRPAVAVTGSVQGATRSKIERMQQSGEIAQGRAFDLPLRRRSTGAVEARDHEVGC